MPADRALLVTLLPLVGALIALLGAVFVAWVNRQTKGMELVYAKKADAYGKFLEQASVLAHSSDTNGEYPSYLRAYHSARLVASETVGQALTGEDGLNGAVQMLRSGDQKDYGRREKIRCEDFHPAMERLIEAMNADLRRLLSRTSGR